MALGILTGSTCQALMLSGWNAVATGSEGRIRIRTVSAITLAGLLICRASSATLEPDSLDLSMIDTHRMLS
jgi:hypothetical protein